MFMFSKERLRFKCLEMALRSKEIEPDMRSKAHVDWIALASVFYNYIKYGKPKD